jgi:hypothetical protein
MPLSKPPVGTGTGDGVDQTARDAAAAAQSDVDALTTKALQFELPFYFTANGAGRYLAVRNVRLATPVAGSTGTFTYERALAATPSTYAAATFPLDMAPGDRFRVTVAGLTTGQDGTVNVLATVL